MTIAYMLSVKLFITKKRSCQTAGLHLRTKQDCTYLSEKGPEVALSQLWTETLRVVPSVGVHAVGWDSNPEQKLLATLANPLTNRREETQGLPPALRVNHQVS